jgi:hypothetical protein
MLAAAVISLVVGMALGQRFKVLVLLPAIGLAVIVTTSAGVLRADDGWSIVWMGVAAAVALQLGYLLGTGIRSFLVADRTTRVLPASAPTRSAH